MLFFATPAPATTISFTVPRYSAGHLPAYVKRMRVYWLDPSTNTWKTYAYFVPRVAGVMDNTRRSFTAPVWATGGRIFVADSAGNAPPDAIVYWSHP